MNNLIIDTIPTVINQLQKNRDTCINAFLGFDACIDNIVRVIKHKPGKSCPEFFITSKQFGEFLISRENMSCGVELQTQLSKIGGNMVITGNALGNLGFKVDCVGTFGFPDVLPVFQTMSDKCTLYTVGETITATALEFTDSKVILFDPEPYNRINWESIRNILGLDRIRELFSGKQLVSLLNWSELENSSDIWQGIIDDVLPHTLFSQQNNWFFTDFSDCSRRSKNEIQSAISKLAIFRKYFRVVLSLNENEANLIARASDLSISTSDEEFLRFMYKVTNTYILVIHRTKDAIAYDGKSFASCDTFFCKEPRILTGGGDNFNAGFCYALSHNFNLFQSLLVANAVSGSYVRTGISPDIDMLIKFLEKNLPGGF
jgi:hypothetical protein